MGQKNSNIDRRFAQMGALYRLASVGGSNGHEERVLNEALRVTREVLGCIKPAIFLVEDGRDEMRRVADIAGDERPDWELSLDLLAGAVRAGPQAFADRDRFSMDWYYPVLGGVLLGEAGLARIEERWSTFGTGAKSASIDFVGGRPPSAGSGKTSWTTSRPRRMIRGAQPS